MGDTPTALGVWNDGRDDLLIVGGPWDTAFGLRLGGIAGWDGRGWRNFGRGLEGSSRAVRTIADFEGRLVVSGDFQRSGSTALPGIAAWDGVAWRAMGTADVRAVDLIDFEGRLIAAGRIEFASGATEIANAAAWDGVEWQPLGGELGPEFTAMTVHNGSLVAAGYESEADGGEPFVVTWDGAEWQRLPGEQAGIVDLLSINGDLVAAGYIQSTDCYGPALRWVDNRWEPIGSGCMGSSWALSTHEGKLVAIGSFANPARPGYVTIAMRWNGTVWESPGGYSSGYPSLQGMEYRGDFVVAGQFGASSNEPGVSEVSGIAKTDFQRWSPIGTRNNGLIYALTKYRDSVVAGGAFLNIDGDSVQSLAEWTGREWRPFGGPIDGSITALRVEGDSLFAAGWFELDESGTVCVAEYRDGTWTAISRGLFGHAVGLDRYQGELIAVGAFYNPPTNTNFFTARWDGTAWRRLASDLSGPAKALAQFDGELYVGGTFGRAGDESANNLARWDGTTWTTVAECYGANGVEGGGTPDDATCVYALAEYDGDLFIGGTFATAGGIPTPNLARWDGREWVVTPGADGSVRMLQVIDDQLYAGGAFTRIGGQDATGLAVWNRETWSQVGDGIATSPRAIVKRGNRLMVAASLNSYTHSIAEFGCRQAVGDVDCDGRLNADDIAAFVMALTDAANYAVHYPDCTIDNADCDGDAYVSVRDIASFVAFLTN
ncbi:MAG: hypothetical protein SF069_16450 [Phycisphaerae bacterium]|nr:hypothetical protein [Phycisphaerae bacterium]